MAIDQTLSRGMRREVALGQAVVLAARLRRAAGVQVQRGQRRRARRAWPGAGRRTGAPRPRARAAAPGPMRSQKSCAPARIGTVESCRLQPSWMPSSIEPLGVLEAPGDHRAPRAVQRDVGAGARVARVGRDAVERLDRHVGAGEVVELEQQVDLPRPRPHGRARGRRRRRPARRARAPRPGRARRCRGRWWRSGPGRGRRRASAGSSRPRAMPQRLLRRAPRGAAPARSSRARPRGARAAARAARCRRCGRPSSASSSTATRSSSTMPGERPKPPRLSAARAEQVGVADAPGELDGGQQASSAPRRRPPASAPGRAASSSSPRRCSSGSGSRSRAPQRRVEEVGGALVGQRRQRLVPGAVGVLERLGGIADAAPPRRSGGPARPRSRPCARAPRPRRRAAARGGWR